ncbi:HAD family hydrolase [Mesorhizobium sp.]|uniref:HAD family hydrolase n=1 Tax=Mesorhizobium sp. TaxID=1871066 RepID=UPI002579D8EF|nr:HAD family hydrolase [Mesorhizobium sp.]
MTEEEHDGRRIAFVDADNTLWDTDGVFAVAQLNLLESIERAVGHSTARSDRLSFVRGVDQALAEQHHLGLRYPPRLLAIGIAFALRGDEAGTAAKRAWEERSTSSGIDPSLVEQIEREFVQYIRRMPDLLPGVRNGLQRLFDGGVLILVLTEGARNRVIQTADQHGLNQFFDRVIEAPKSERLFQRVQKLARVRLPAFMIGDQLQRDIAPAKAAGLVTIYIPSRFRPQWEPDEAAVGPDYRVEQFDQGADIILATNQQAGSSLGRP